MTHSCAALFEVKAKFDILFCTDAELSLVNFATLPVIGVHAIVSILCSMFMTCVFLKLLALGLMDNTPTSGSSPVHSILVHERTVTAASSV